MIYSDEVIRTETGQSYRNNASPYEDCESTMVIYLITCNKCKMQYVGKTERMLKERHREHRYEWSHGTTPLGRHFWRCYVGYNEYDQMKIQVRATLCR